MWVEQRESTYSCFHEMIQFSIPRICCIAASTEGRVTNSRAVRCSRVMDGGRYWGRSLPLDRVLSHQIYATYLAHRLFRPLRWTKYRHFVTDSRWNSLFSAGLKLRLFGRYLGPHQKCVMSASKGSMRHSMSNDLLPCL